MDTDNSEVKARGGGRSRNEEVKGRKKGNICNTLNNEDNFLKKIPMQG